MHEPLGTVEKILSTFPKMVPFTGTARVEKPVSKRAERSDTTLISWRWKNWPRATSGKKLPEKRQEASEADSLAVAVDHFQEPQDGAHFEKEASKNRCVANDIQVDPLVLERPHGKCAVHNPGYGPNREGLRKRGTRSMFLAFRSFWPMNLFSP